MNVIEQPQEFSATGRKVSLAIGMFDGVHLGHQQVIRQAITDAEQHEGAAVAVTFDRHPNSVVAPERTPPLIYSLSNKMRVLASLSLDTALLLHFDRALSEQSPEQFIRNLVEGFGSIQSICVGSKFTFGHKRAGNVALLQELGAHHGFAVHGLAAVALDGKAVSSTRIREAIRTGDLDHASQMLGRAYSLAGTIQTGDQLGRQLGFPTANLAVDDLALPPTGVYAAHAQLGDKAWRAVVNIGFRPTVSGTSPLRVEAHLLGFSANIYGREIELTFVEKIRDEMKFSSTAALAEQIRRDIQAANRLFG